MRNIIFDPCDYDAMVALMDDCESYATMLMGANVYGECETLSILQDKIILCTYQDNGYTKTQVFWRDGTVEISFSKE